MDHEPGQQRCTRRHTAVPALRALLTGSAARHPAYAVHPPAATGLSHNSPPELQSHIPVRRLPCQSHVEPFPTFQGHAPANTNPMFVLLCPAGVPAARLFLYTSCCACHVACQHFLPAHHALCAVSQTCGPAMARAILAMLILPSRLSATTLHSRPPIPVYFSSLCIIPPVAASWFFCTCPTAVRNAAHLWPCPNG